MSGTAQPAPSGLRRIPFPLESYQHPSPPLSAKRLLNYYAEAQPADARTDAALIPTHGLVAAIDVGQAPIRAMNSDNPGALYIAAGSHFYRFGVISGAPEDLGDIGVPTSTFARDTLTTIAVGPDAAVVCVPPNAYTCSHTGQLNQIGGAFPGASSVAYLDGYFVFTAYWSTITEGARFFATGLLNPANYDALDFAYADGEPNVVRRVIAHRGELWFLGEAAIEVWYDAGAADFPFRRQSGGVIHTGNASPKVAATGDGSVFWLGMADNVVYRSNGYRAARISTHAIEAIIGAAGGASTADLSLVYSYGGHVFYCLNIGNRTLAYDCATQKWHDRASSGDGSGRWRVGTAARLGNSAALGDALTGQIYVPDAAYLTDGGTHVLRQVTMPPLFSPGQQRLFCGRAEIEMELGYDPVPAPVLLEWSDDGALTWKGPRSLSLGAINTPRKRVPSTRLGSFRQRIFRISTSGNPTLYAVDADVSAGAV
jgi:hypothetical protein